MKNLLFIITLFCCQMGYAQDAIIFKNGDTLNCKISEVTKDEIYFSVAGVGKKVPFFSVQNYYMNTTFAVSNTKPVTKDTTSVVTMTYAELSMLLNQKVAETKTNELNYQGAYTAFTLSGIAAGGALICGLVMLTSSPPTDIPILTLNPDGSIPKSYISDMEKYANEAESYASTMKTATALGITFIGAAIISTAVGSYKLAEVTEKKLSIRPTNTGVGFIYKF